MAPTLDPRRADETTINLFHPIYHCYTYPLGCRVDIERILPADLEGMDEDELIDEFSEPPAWMERFSPLAVQVGDQVMRGKNYSDLMLKVYRMMIDLFQGVGRFIDSTLSHATGEDSIRFPFMSLCVDPDTLHRLVESDFESGETAYSNLMRLFADGILTPCLTTPFHVILPLLESDAEIRLCARVSLIFYLRLMRNCNQFLERNGEQGLLVVPFWLPESGYSERVMRILDEEFTAFCQKQKLGQSHLVILLDNHQVRFDENDVLMKSWNLIDRPSAATGKNGRSGKNGSRPRVVANSKGKTVNLHEGVHGVSVVFRDRAFSDWVIHANPSVKKLLDRTIAKVDSDINGQNVHYGWSHFEELEAITYSPRSLVNFQQKLVKLTELGYLPLSPDFYVRGKLRGEFGFTEKEPIRVKLEDTSAGNGWDLGNGKCLCRWLGTRRTDANGGQEITSHPYEQSTPEGPVKKPGCAIWKVAWTKARQKCHRAVVGNLETLEGGMTEVLRDLTGLSCLEKARANVEDFLAHYAYIYWREHFIQHDMAEADINVLETSNKHLRAGNKELLDARQAAIAGAAAQAVFFSLDSARSQGLGFENMDQRLFYQNVVMLTLAICNAMHVYHWIGDKRSAKRLLGLLQTELLDFEGAHERYGLEATGISKNQWKQCIKSEIDESKDNVVRRAALRVAARHLRPLGYVKEFSRADAALRTNVGHVWTLETGRESFAYENQRFCGVSED
jgi:hypothetical protein